MELTETNFSEGSEIQERLELRLISDRDEPTIIDSDHQIELIVKALSSKTRRKILQQIQTSEVDLDVSNIASQLDMTEANISAQIKKLKEAGLIECIYCSGQHGVRKVSKLKYDKLLIRF
ncbi:MAG: helix-turn-helix domain-containing protein [Candidatus Lokiarchaeota archaeon]|nr:helix-turn-helix domain-containing protein [Candidatus Lokiarchaeota archaeon]